MISKNYQVFFTVMWCAGNKISGEDAPLATQLSEWLEAHPGWIVAEEDSDSDEDDSDEDENGEPKGNRNLINLGLLGVVICVVYLRDCLLLCLSKIK